MILNPVLMQKQGNPTVVQTGCFVDHMSGSSTTQNLSAPADCVAVLFIRQGARVEEIGEWLNPGDASATLLKPGESIENDYLMGTLYFSENKTELKIENPTGALELVCFYIAFNL